MRAVQPVSPPRKGVLSIPRLLVIAAVAAIVIVPRWLTSRPEKVVETKPVEYARRHSVDTGGNLAINTNMKEWPATATLQELSDLWETAATKAIEGIDEILAKNEQLADDHRYSLLESKASLLNFEGTPKQAYLALEKARAVLEANSDLAKDELYSLIYFQGVTALRRGENENCIMCRGESSCILPISEAARHTNPTGSQLAIKHFTEYLEKFPDDLGVRWLLNIAHMTLGEHPDKVDPRYLMSLGQYAKPEFDIGRFRDIGHLVGLDQLTWAGGAIMEDFDNDGLLDIVITSMDPTCQMNLLRSTGKGTFEDRTAAANLTGQLGGLNCVQTDYNNDGRMDIFVARGAWFKYPMRPSLLRNNSDGTFTDVTAEAGLMHPINSISTSWADYDNDGWLDLFVCCEMQPCRLYHNLKDGTFEEVSIQAGVLGNKGGGCKGAAWFDFDNDDYPDLFLNYMLPQPSARLYRNRHDGTFEDVTQTMEISGPVHGFSCWAWDFNNDGWLDIYANCFESSIDDVVEGLTSQRHRGNSNRLYKNLRGKGFKDVAKEQGLAHGFSAMGSNFGDFDGDGYLDMYLGTGSPDLAMLVPNRMFKNVDGKRFSEITASAGTGNLQKGHGVACGDWDRNGSVDIFIEMGGAVKGDKYHNILFQNPGHDNRWITIKLTGDKSNRAAIGARIKVVTAGAEPQTIHRHVTSGSSFGGSPLQQTIGLGKAERIAMLEIHWPTTGLTQSFQDIAVDQAIAITESAETYQTLDWTPLQVPEGDGHGMGSKK